MKEATGELNMTVVTLIAIAAIGGIFYIFVWPMIQRTIVERTCQTYGTSYHATEVADKEAVGGQTDAKVKVWKCCPTGSSGSVDQTKCVDAN